MIKEALPWFSLAITLVTLVFNQVRSEVKSEEQQKFLAERFVELKQEFSKFRDEQRQDYRDIIDRILVIERGPAR